MGRSCDLFTWLLQFLHPDGFAATSSKRVSTIKSSLSQAPFLTKMEPLWLGFFFFWGGGWAGRLFLLWITIDVCIWCIGPLNCIITVSLLKNLVSKRLKLSEEITKFIFNFSNSFIIKTRGGRRKAFQQDDVAYLKEGAFIEANTSCSQPPEFITVRIEVSYIKTFCLAKFL